MAEHGRAGELEELKKILFDAKDSAKKRLCALSSLKELHASDGAARGAEARYVNNHIHTCYSFSPYTPSAAVYSAWTSGLRTAGIMDHDSIGGADEFIKAGEILSMPVTVGCEMRVSVKGTPLEGRRLNNPDQISCAYVAMHGISHKAFSYLESVLAEKRRARNIRNRLMCERINALAKPFGAAVSFDTDVAPLSECERGGSITERHVLYALARAICERYPDRRDTLSVIERMSDTPLGEKKRESLLSAPDEFYMYDLLGVMKSGLIEKIYIDADDELLGITDFVSLAERCGAVSAYAYLGDVGESPTGDKKAQKFEDDYIEPLFSELRRLGFNAVTYMPSRNTPEQLSRVMALCEKYGFFQISGEDINSPRQSFICRAAEKPEFEHLKKATYALIGHEICSTENIGGGMFSESLRGFPLDERIEKFAKIGGFRP